MRRFLKNVAVQPDGCWLWTAGTSSDGYGCFNVRVAGRPGRFLAKGSHRVAYVHYRGPLTPGLELDHLCRVPTCVNPDHLEEVTHAENIRRNPNRRAPKGDEHWTRRHPENVVRGDAHYARMTPGLKCGEGNGRAKLTEADVRAIRRSTLGSAAIARQYGMGRTAIKDVRSRRKWSHVP